MLKKTSILLIGLFFCALLLEGLAEARRIGGGRSFGSRPSYQRSTNNPTTPQRDSSQPGQAQSQQGAAQRPGGLFGGPGSMLGGLVMGSLIGSLLFGGMRGFGGPGVLDFLIIGGGLFLLFRFLRARRAAMQAAGPMPFEGTGVDPYSGGVGSGLGTAWGGLSSAPGSASGLASSIPPGFDIKEFLDGAKAAYHRLQESWNKRDLEDIRHFTSPEVYEEIKRQAQEDPLSGETEIVLVNAQLLEVRSEGEDTVASVNFDVLMRESPEEQRAKQVREVWHFSRKESIPGSFWVLEGIQQLED